MDSQPAGQALQLALRSLWPKASWTAAHQASMGDCVNGSRCQPVLGSLGRGMAQSGIGCWCPHAGTKGCELCAGQDIAALVASRDPLDAYCENTVKYGTDSCAASVITDFIFQAAPQACSAETAGS